MNFIQPDSPMERNTFACSHTQFKQAMNYILWEADEKFDGEKTEIHFQGEVSWPLHWSVRRYVTQSHVPASTKARYVIVDSTVFDNMVNPPLYKGNYDWAVRRFRHYWVPTPIDWKAMKKVHLLLRSGEGMDEEQKRRREACILQWKKFWYAVIVRDEEVAKDKGTIPWNWLGGYDCYIGRLKS
jgi:hypothetical protein